MKKIYDIFIVLLALISIVLVIADFCKQIDINSVPYVYIDNSILIVFAVDYFTRLFLAKDKKHFFMHNIFDLLSIIPVSSLSIFRIARITRVARLFRLFRFVGLSGKFEKNVKKFLNTNGFIYLAITCLIILLVSAGMYSISENVSFGESLWWAIATATTVGYGDISPHTIIGKFAAVLLMFIGIGFIGMFTSSITAYFTHENDESKDNEILKKLDELQKEINELKRR
ncbi:ion transporter [Liquorilactobacillus vini]|uniref:ion transporter n=1 Tax=Liquorilactobacillus vini TaxID=238015 RepID=UPI00054D4E71|nr:potassium channel family protein [Liquorilactobacillus vini]